MAEDGFANESFVVLSIFTSAPELRESFVHLIEEFAGTQTQLQPGIRSAEVFMDEGSEQIVTLVRWKDRTSYEEFRRSESGMQASRVALTLRPKVYFLHAGTKVTKDTAMPVQVKP